MRTNTRGPLIPLSGRVWYHSKCSTCEGDITVRSTKVKNQCRWCTDSCTLCDSRNITDQTDVWIERTCTDCGFVSTMPLKESR